MAIGIQCCKDCVPPKRHLGCHAKCKEYQQEKAQFEEDKKKMKDNCPPNMSIFDFERFLYSGHGQKRKR